MKILVINGSNYGSSVEALGEIVTNPKELITNPKEIGLIMFTGGADITPEYYGHTSPNGICYSNKERDDEEIKIFKLSQELGIRSIGICRGIQFINTMAGGTMIHHVNRHAGTQHEMETSTGKIIKINSLHHQMVTPPEDAIVIGWAKKRMSDIYIGDEDKKIEAPNKETEAVLFPNIQSAGVQYHPEMLLKESDGAIWFYELAKDLIEIKHFSDIIKKHKGKTCQYKSIQVQ